MSMRACERVFKRPFGTIAKIVRDVGDWALDYHRNSPPVTCDRIQADEIWSFIGENDRQNLLKPNPGIRGVSWTFLAVDRPTKLVVAYHVGTRGGIDATKFFRKLDDRLAKDDAGNFLRKPTIATDGHKAYVDSAEKVFGDRVDFGQYQKQYSKLDKNGEPLPGSRFVGAVRNTFAGNPDMADLTTWLVERENGALRQMNRRFTRKTNGFSKMREYHERQLAIGIHYRNYCWIPRPSRPRDGPPNWLKRIPAAMMAGLTDRVWTPEDMIEAADEFIANRAEPDKSPEPVEAIDQEKLFWVVHQPYHQKARIHKTGCSSCKGGLGRMDGESKRTFWYGFPTEEAATAFAAEKEPDDFKVCKKCLGEYNTLSRYGRRR
jgi:IS1 family transposase